jgi:hypothetical protein
MPKQPPPPDPEAAKAYVASLDFTDCENVRLPAAELDGLMRKAIAEAMPAGAGMCFNYDGPEAVVAISRPGDTRQVMAAARQSLDR